MAPRRRIIRQVPGALRRSRYKLSALAPDEWRLLMAAPLALPLTALALRRWGLRRVQATLAVRRPRSRPEIVNESATARRIAWCVQVTAAYAPWPANCLQRSVVLWWFLLRRGIDSDLRIGVRRGDHGVLDFHAWIEHGGEVINDRPAMRAVYATFDRAIAPSSATFR